MPTIKQILTRSNKAICGIGEKEVTVATKNLEASINKLRKAGFYVVGKSLDKGSKFQKVWFTRPGSL